MTWSPFFSVVTPGPTSTTMPAPSWPRMAGKSPSGSAPESVYSSVWQMPVGLHLHHHFACLRPVDFDRLNRQGFARRAGHSGTGFHRQYPELLALEQFAKSLNRLGD